MLVGSRPQVPYIVGIPEYSYLIVSLISETSIIAVEPKFFQFLFLTAIIVYSAATKTELGRSIRCKVEQSAMIYWHQM